MKAISGSFNTDFDLSELKAFQKARVGDLGTSERAVKQAIEAGLVNVQWMEQNYEVRGRTSKCDSSLDSGSHFVGG